MFFTQKRHMRPFSFSLRFNPNKVNNIQNIIQQMSRIYMRTIFANNFEGNYEVIQKKELVCSSTICIRNHQRLAIFQLCFIDLRLKMKNSISQMFKARLVSNFQSRKRPWLEFQRVQTVDAQTPTAKEPANQVCIIQCLIQIKLHMKIILQSVKCITSETKLQTDPSYDLLRL